MKLHIFNPGHDIALAHNRPHLTMPHAAQQLRMNMGWIPALWAWDGDCVLVDDVDFALKASSRFADRLSRVRFISHADLCRIPIHSVHPWGWDITLATELAEAGISRGALPEQSRLDSIRALSSRRLTIDVLGEIRPCYADLTCGEACYVTTVADVHRLMARHGRVVLKAPWSSSGRGVRYVEGVLSPSVAGWLDRTVKMQGGVMVEPYYNKVVDFGMEFAINLVGQVAYRGLSLFHTQNGAYTGNILATEQTKLDMLDAYIPQYVLSGLSHRLCRLFSRLLGGAYAGPLGVDMMVVQGTEGKGYLLHPCVEVNLRRTMGHVALALTPPDIAEPQLMQIVHDPNYRIKLSRYWP